MNIANKIIKTEEVNWKELKWLQGKLKKHNKEQIERLKKSLIKNNFFMQFFVWQEDENNIWILDGHHRKLALEELQKENYNIPERLPATFLDVKDKKEAYKIVLLFNSIYAKIDEVGLSDFINLAKLNENDIEEVDVGINLNKLIKKALTEEQLDEIPEPPKEPISKLGDIYLLDNKHRVMCGDSTKKEDVEKLMDGKKADMVFNDPPYDLDAKLLKQCYDNIECDNQIWMLSDIVLLEFAKVINKRITSLIIFYLKAVVPNNFYLYRRHIPAIHICEHRKKIFNNVKRGFSTVIEIKYRNTFSDKIIEHQKPIEALEPLILSFTKINQIVVDLFGGSGTTLIACEQFNRQARIMELDTKHVDIILKRFYNLYPDKEIKCLNRNINIKQSIGEI